MANEKVAWITPSPSGKSSFCILPDGRELHREDAEAEGFTVAAWPENERIAVPFGDDPARVVLARGLVVHSRYAIINGFTVSDSLPEAVKAVSPAQAWQSAIKALPEASDRMSAAAELLTTQSHTTLTVDAAQAFLRGLPTENTLSVGAARAFLHGLPMETTKEEPTMSINDHNPERAARREEIKASLSAFNKSRGYGPARGSAVSASVSKSLDGVDPAKLKRSAEIRLNALENNQASEASAGETKKLRYALQVHAEVGTPLLDVFSQLNVDTSKISR